MTISATIVTPVPEQIRTVAHIGADDVHSLLRHEDEGPDQEDFPAFLLATDLLTEELDRIDAQGFGLRIQPCASYIGKPLERATRVLELIVSLVAMDCLPMFTDDPDAYAGIVVAEFRGDGQSVVLTHRGARVVVAVAVHDIEMPVSRGNCVSIEPVNEVRLTVDGIRLNADPLSKAAIHIGQVFRASFAADWRMWGRRLHQPRSSTVTRADGGQSQPPLS